MQRKTKEQRMQEALDYIESHTKTEYRHETDWTLDHKYTVECKTVDVWDARKAVRIALGIY